MSEIPSVWQTNVYAFISHATEPRILMMPGKAGWSLPSLQFPERLRFGNVAPIIQKLRDTLNCDITVVRCTDIRYAQKDTQQQVDMIFTLESTNPGWVPPAEMQWIGRETLDSLPLALPEQREVIATCLHEEETHSIPALRPPWERRGWFASAVAWIRKQLAQAGYTVVAPVEQVRIWGISCILRAQTTAGMVYFKTSPFPVADENKPLPLLFANEAALTRGLAALYPEHIPTSLAVDTTLGWMLLEDVGKILQGHPVMEVWEDALRTFSRIQVASAGHVETLLATGCLDRRLEKLAGQIDLLLSDAEALTYLDRGEVEQLRAYAPRFKAMCSQLASYNIPPTLVHGDLHPGNIGLRQGKLLFFDWTDGCVSHPFFDTITFWEEVESDASRSRLRDVYLAEWIAYEPIGRLIEAIALGETLGMLHQVVSYQHIMANMEPLWHMGIGGGLTFWVRRLLKSMDTRHQGA